MALSDLRDELEVGSLTLRGTGTKCVSDALLGVAVHNLLLLQKPVNLNSGCKFGLCPYCYTK